MEMTDNNVSEKAKLLVETAKKLFFRYGIKRVTVEEICHEAQISKMTFYRYFPDKIAIAKRVITSIYHEGKEKYDTVIQQEIPFEEKVQQILLMKLEFSKQYSDEFINEFIKGTTPEIERFIQEQNQKYFTEVKHLFIEAQHAGEIRSDIKIEFILYMLNTMRELFKDENLRNIYPDTATLMKEVFNFFYYGVLSRK